MRQHNRAKNYALRFILPLVITCGVALLWQKVIAPHYWGELSRIQMTLEGGGMQKALLSAGSWFIAVRSDLPWLLRRSLGYPVPAYTLLCCVVLGIMMLSGARKSRDDGKVGFWNVSRWGFLGVAVLSLSACGLLYLLSCRTAEIGGYESRGLSSTWMALALCAAGLVYWFRHMAVLIAVAGAGMICTHSFSLQRDIYCDVAKVQQAVLADVTARVKDIDMTNAVILADVPWSPQKTYNEETVFTVTWDFGPMIAMHNPGKIRGGSPYNMPHLRTDIANNTDPVFENVRLKRAENLWFYRFDPGGKSGMIMPVTRFEQLEELVRSPVN